ncbi:LysM peptidoglycan-binding domain-containing protein [Rhizobium sp. FY34]|uniref:LysM peptidoglycan-binding domain-containing protein n=1 Tax=Rhizobium sp. FY34 TaxID=2562309 RepID=UPI0010C154FE|nr:LysM peptidoglycan-binding domain-containing protein [Rhizobium sp. FY34]
MMKNRAGWLAISVLAIATILMVFFVMPRLSSDTKPVGEVINAAGQEIKDAVTQGGDAARQLVDPTPEKAPAQAAKTDSLPAPQPAASSPAKTALIIPTFDVLRVEPDGSTVIAGRAEPKAKLEVADQVETVATTGVDKAGEFVAILDQPLAPGDHQLVLKATTEDGRTVMSEEIATVSVPVTKDGELLALVTKPGEASRILAMPNVNQKTKTERVALGGAETAAPALPAPAAQASAGVAAAPVASQPVAQVAKPVESAAAPANPVPDAGDKPALQVTAVEIEGDRLFIAGISKTGARLKGYADDQAIGEATAGSDGHFVIDGIMPLSVGEHRIAVDQIGANGKVIVRVEVPFNRPAGEQVAAVATAPQAGASTLTQIDDGAFDRLRNDVSRAFQLLVALYADGKIPTDEQVAAARSSISIALRSLSEYRLPAGVDANTSMIAENTVKQAAAALAALDALPRDVASVGQNLKAIGEMIARAVGPVLPNGTVAPLAAAATATSQPLASRTIAQAPLTQSEASSVIIRRGDTLWQISRRVYGQGVRYTTIYLANQDQIANPNLIEPGQIFGVPKDALPDDEAEKLHRRLNRS